MRTRFQGVVPPVLTPLTPTGEIDTESLRRIVERMIAAGVDGLFALGSSAEAAFLGRERRRLVTSTIVDAARGRVPVLCGAIDMTTPLVVDHVQDARDNGVAGIVATAPFYVRTHDAEISRHFRLVKQASGELPVFAYNIPVSVHSSLSPQLLLELAEAEILAGVKDSGGVDASTRELVEVRNARGLQDFLVFTGSETTVDLAYLAGVDGVVPGLGNVDPVRYVHMVKLLRDARYDEAAAIQRDINKLFQIVFVGDPSRMGGSSRGLGGFKAALHHLGIIDCPKMSEPHVPLNDQEVATIAAIVDAAHISEPASSLDQ